MHSKMSHLNRTAGYSSSSFVGLLALVGMHFAMVAEASSYFTQTSKNEYTISAADRELLKTTIYDPVSNIKNKPIQPRMRAPVVREEDLPIEDPKHKWQSLNPDVEFIPADGIDPRLVRRFLEDEGSSSEQTSVPASMSKSWASIYDVEPFATGEEEYDEYQQAWRLLGFIVDCNPMVDDDYYDNGHGSQDHGTSDGCARYVLWAAVSEHKIKKTLATECLFTSIMFLSYLVSLLFLPDLDQFSIL